MLKPLLAFASSFGLSAALIQHYAPPYKPRPTARHVHADRPTAATVVVVRDTSILDQLERLFRDMQNRPNIKPTTRPPATIQEAVPEPIVESVSEDVRLEAALRAQERALVLQAQRALEEQAQSFAVQAELYLVQKQRVSIL